jgi:hypothetical protein
MPANSSFPRNGVVSAETSVATRWTISRSLSRAAPRRPLSCVSCTLADRLLLKSAPPAIDGVIAGAVVEQRQSRSRGSEAGVDETLFPSLCFPPSVSLYGFLP